jgi:predicted nucleic acid-binding protein
VGVHSFVIGELACGNLAKREDTLNGFMKLEHALIADESEVLHLLHTHRLWGTGLGWTDVHILAAAFLTGWNLLTSDHAMAAAAAKLGIAYPVQ